MNLTSEIFGNVIVVHTPEELGFDHVAGFEAAAAALERNRVVLDLDHTELLDSAGLTAILDLQEKLRDVGGDVKLAVSGAVNRKVLEITRLDQQLEVFDNVLDAVKSYQ